ncbi:hypothetical protein PHET_11871, partial [Paragonimus heterotremus]
HLENGTIIWSPHFQKDRLLLETVQRRAAKAVRSLKTRPYEERLKSLDMYFLEYRRLTGDLVLIFLIMISPDHPCRLMPNRRSSVTLRGHPIKIDVQHSRLKCGQLFLIARLQSLECFTRPCFC